MRAMVEYYIYAADVADGLSGNLIIKVIGTNKPCIDLKSSHHIYEIFLGIVWDDLIYKLAGVELHPSFIDRLNRLILLWPVDSWVAV